MTRSNSSIGSGSVVLLILFIAIGISFIIRYDHEVNCDKDPPIIFSAFSANDDGDGNKNDGNGNNNNNNNVSIDSCLVYSETYNEARNKFRQIAKELYDPTSSKLYTYDIVKNDDDENNNYKMDILVVKGTVPGTVVHTSGVHGVEGYAGSAVQLSFLKYILPTIISTTGKKEYPTFIIIHAINPYGMAHYRRVNENNIDINRNGCSEEQWNKASKQDPNIAGYDDFDDLFNTPRAPTLYDMYFLFWYKASFSIYKHGLLKLKTAMVTGQYHKPRGIFHGGQEHVEKSLDILRNVFWKQYIEENSHSSLGVVTWIDVHTGLGKSGEDTLIAFPEEDRVVKELNHWFPNSHIPGNKKTAKEDTQDDDNDDDDSNDIAQDVVGGYELSMGQTTEYVSAIVPKDHKMLALNQEFGTVSPIKAGHALVLENMMAQYGLNRDEKLEFAKRTTRRAFYVRTTKWRNSIVTRGLNLLLQSMNRSLLLSTNKETEQEKEEVKK